MNKKVFGRKLSRSRPAREALFSTLMRSVILNGKIETTKAKAKAVQGDLERFITLAKKGELEGKRKIFAGLDNAQDALDALYQKVVPAFSSKTSGFTRIISLPNRRGDNAQMVRLELTEKPVEIKKEVVREVKKEIKEVKKAVKKTAPKKEVKK